VLEDVRDGFVTPQAAREYYGVVIAGGQIDEGQTTALRAQGMATNRPARFDLGDRRQAFLDRHPTAVLDCLSELLTTLPATLRYRAKQIAFAHMRSCDGPSVDPDWLRAEWPHVKAALLGR
jgi:N-methylhydantoinase B